MHRYGSLCWRPEESFVDFNTFDGEIVGWKRVFAQKVSRERSAIVAYGTPPQEYFSRNDQRHRKDKEQKSKAMASSNFSEIGLKKTALEIVSNPKKY